VRAPVRCAELLLLDTDVIGFLWTAFGTLILFTRVDGREAEIIEEIEASRGACSEDDPGSAWDVVCDLDQIIDGSADDPL
jgi:hypothetical protein